MQKKIANFIAGLKKSFLTNNPSVMFTILLAEDDIDDQELLAEAFSQIDPALNLVSFSTGRKILAYLETHDIPDIIVLDYNIPEINGADILKHLDDRKRFDSVVKLVWSTSNSPLYENSCMQLGARAYLVKPSSISGLSELAKKMLSFVSQPSDFNA